MCDCGSLGMGLRTSGIRISTRAWYIKWSQVLIHLSTVSFLHSTNSCDLGSRASISLMLLQNEKQNTTKQKKKPRLTFFFVCFFFFKFLTLNILIFILQTQHTACISFT